LIDQGPKASLEGQIQWRWVSQQQRDGWWRIETAIPAQGINTRLRRDALIAGFPDDSIDQGRTEQGDAGRRWIMTKTLNPVLRIRDRARWCQASQIHEQGLWSLGRPLEGPEQAFSIRRENTVLRYKVYQQACGALTARSTAHPTPREVGTKLRTGRCRQHRAKHEKTQQSLTQNGTAHIANTHKTTLLAGSLFCTSNHLLP